MSRFERQSAGDKNVKKIRKVISILSSTLISLTFRRRRRKMFNVELRGDTPKSQSCDLHLITRFILFAYRQFTWAGCEWFFWFFFIACPDSGLPDKSDHSDLHVNIPFLCAFCWDEFDFVLAAVYPAPGMSESMCHTHNGQMPCLTVTPESPKKIHYLPFLFFLAQIFLFWICIHNNLITLSSSFVLLWSPIACLFYDFMNNILRARKADEIPKFMSWHLRLFFCLFSCHICHEHRCMVWYTNFNAVMMISHLHPNAATFGSHWSCIFIRNWMRIEIKWMCQVSSRASIIACPCRAFSVGQNRE